MPENKLVIGMAAYARGFRLLDGSASNGIGAPATGASPPGEYTLTGGILAYYEVSLNVGCVLCGHVDAFRKVAVDTADTFYRSG